MTLDELILKLQAVRDEAAKEMYLNIGGAVRVFVNCPVSHADGWLQSNNIRLMPGDDNEPIRVVIEGGFGA